MDIARQREQADAFRQLHDRTKILVLPNSWDAASAKIFETAGFPAVATTSSGVANSLGYPDGEVVPRDEMIAAIAHIARVLAVPLSADIESGYASDSESLGATIRAVIDAGAVGINFEDGMHDGSHQLFPLDTAVARIKSVRAIADGAGVPIVINARTDVYLHAIGEQSSRFEHTVTRANAYLTAGADCAFVPGIADADTIGRVAAAIKGPINVMAVPGTPNAPQLQKLGVARVSMGGGPARAALTAVRRIAEQLMRDGSYSGFTSRDIISHLEMNRLLSKKP